MSFGIEDLITEFNFVEALFWLMLGSGFLIALKWTAHCHRTWLIFSGLNLTLLGLTDIVELYTGGFLHTATWLLWWKVVHVLGLVVSVVWYLRLRSSD